MLIKYVLYLVNVLVRAFEGTTSRVLGIIDSLVVVRGPRIVLEGVLQILESLDRLLVVGKGYLKRVRKTLRYRLYFEAVTGPMRTRYRELKRQ
jgi:hypothetical protein